MILDVTAGYRGIWFSKDDSDTVFLDRKKDCRPMVQGVWQSLPFPDNLFDMVVFDPPHMVLSEQNKGVMKARYGYIDNRSFHSDFYRAFRELFRVLKASGFLILKWNDHDKGLDKVLALTDMKPLFGQKTAVRTKHSSSTYWICFRK